MAEKNVAYSYSQLESQTNNEQLHSVNEPTAIEWCMMRRASKWVYFISILQMILGFFSVMGGGILMGVLSIIFASFGINGVRRRNVRHLTAHFVYSLAMYILTLVSIVLLIIYCEYCPIWIYIFSFLFQILLAVGMRHSRILIGLLKLYPHYQNTSSKCERKQTPASIPMEVSTQTAQVHVQNEQPTQIPMQFYPQVVAVPPNAPFMTMQPIRYQQPIAMPSGYPMMHPAGYPVQMQPYFAPYPVAPVPPSQDNNNNNNNGSTALYPANNVPGVYRQV